MEAKLSNPSFVDALLAVTQAPHAKTAIEDGLRSYAGRVKRNLSKYHVDDAEAMNLVHQVVERFIPWARNELGQGRAVGEGAFFQSIKRALIDYQRAVKRRPRLESLNEIEDIAPDALPASEGAALALRELEYRHDVCAICREALGALRRTAARDADPDALEYIALLIDRLPQAVENGDSLWRQIDAWFASKDWPPNRVRNARERGERLPVVVRLMRQLGSLVSR